jgi:class 3 adenylate cyclase
VRGLQRVPKLSNSTPALIDKYLGDGFFAYWRDDPRFTLALHFGLVAIGGVPSMGEESLMGKEVNFVFRMEKLVASLGIYLLQRGGDYKLGSLIRAEPAGSHELKGFEGAHEFFSC